MQKTVPIDRTSPPRPSPPELLALPALLADFEARTHALQTTHAQLAAQVAQLHGQLQTAHERMQLLLESLSAAVIVIQEQRVEHFNRAAHKWLPDMAIGQTWQLPESWRPGPSPREFQLESARGTSTLLVEENQYQNMRIVHIQDISQTVEEYQQTARTRRLAAMGQMSAGIAHQIRTPLSTAVLHASQLMQQDLPEVQRSRHAGRLRQQLLQLEKLVSAMLQLARNEPLRMRPHSLDELLALVRTSVQALCEERAVGLQLPTGLSQACVLRADRQLLASALTALVENAIQASRSGQVVRLTASHDGAHCEVTVWDEGPGIGQEQREHLFEPFHTRRPGGTGLGLSVAQQIILEHGGSIACVPAQGGCFRVQLPLEPSAPT